MGFAYRYYITQEKFESVPEDERGNILMRAVLLDEEQIARYSDILSPLPDTSPADRGYDDYVLDCSDRRAAGITEFTAARTGFTAVTDYDSDQLVFSASLTTTALPPPSTARPPGSRRWTTA